MLRSLFVMLKALNKSSEGKYTPNIVALQYT